MSRPTLQQGLLHHLLDNRRDVRDSAVDRRETGVGLIEDEVKVGAGEHNRLNVVAMAERSGDLVKTCFILA